jgi:hypothetical protein
MTEILSNSIITLSFLLLLFIPLYALSRSSAKKNREKLLTRFRELCTEKGLSATETILVGNRVIGFDVNRKIVAGLLVVAEGDDQFIIERGKVSKSEVVKSVSQSSVTDIKLLYITEGQHKQVVFYTRYKDDERTIVQLMAAAEKVNLFLQQKEPFGAPEEGNPAVKHRN